MSFIPLSPYAVYRTIAGANTCGFPVKVKQSIGPLADISLCKRLRMVRNGHRMMRNGWNLLCYGSGATRPR
ncbi:hypothetical protein TNCV_770311 [Trichonephila clavipes]|nr:hypothetical protein TNCV_770311 [Trichonephila clavipes]